MRPSWQIDLKWAAGILACVSVLVAGFLFSLTQLTSRDTATPLSTALIAIGINERVTDEEYAALQATASANPEAEVSLSPVSIKVKGSEIASLDKDAASRLIAGKLAVVLYEQGISPAEALIVTPPPESEKKAITLGPSGGLTSSMHSEFRKYFTISAIVAFVLLAVVAGMSRGPGRIGAPAFITALSTAPLAALWALVAQAVGEGDGTEKPAILAAREAARSAAGDLRSTFLLVAGVAFATAVLALVGGIAYAIFRRMRKARGSAPPTLAPTLAAGKPQSLVESEPAS